VIRMAGPKNANPLYANSRRHLYNFHGWLPGANAARAMQGLRPRSRGWVLSEAARAIRRHNHTHAAAETTICLVEQETPSQEQPGITPSRTPCGISASCRTREMMARLIESFHTAPRPFLLMKCSGGQGRASFAAALYLIPPGRMAGDGGGAAGQFARLPTCIYPRRAAMAEALPLGEFRARRQVAASSWRPGSAKCLPRRKMKPGWTAGAGGRRYASIFTATTRRSRPGLNNHPIRLESPTRCYGQLPLLCAHAHEGEAGF